MNHALRSKAARVATALEELEAANAVLQPLITEPLAPQIPGWFPGIVNQKIWNMRKQFETELTRLDLQLEKAVNGANAANGAMRANAANGANRTNAANGAMRTNAANMGPTMYPELTNAELSVFEKEIEYLMKDAKVLERKDFPAFTQVEFKNAVVVGNADVVHLLLHDPTIDPTAHENLAIRSASEKGHVDVVKVLLADSRVDPSADDNFAIRVASQEGHLGVVEVLLADPRIDPSARVNLAIRSASRNGHADVVRLLLKRREVVARGLSREYIDAGKTEEIRKLLRETFTAVGGRRKTRRQTRRQTRTRNRRQSKR